jgi:hypothetical protein
MKRWLLPFTLSLAYLCSEDYNINLKDPVFTHGTISTDQGGIICGSQLRIQAQKIEYTNKVENGIAVKKVVAEGDLLLEYNGRIFVGRKLEYDLVTKTGVMFDGRTTTDYWFIGGDEIELLPDGSFWVEDAYLTTVESQDAWWELRSSKIDITSKSFLSAKNIKIRFFDIPIFWFPSFKIDLKLLKEPPIKYKFLWDQVLKQKIMMRYELYSNEVFNLYGRLDYRFKKGPGAAIETDYHSRDERTLFITKSYGAFDKIVPDESNNRRYRLQGLLTSHSDSARSKFHMSYDKMSDDKMPQDFKSDDFEIGTQKRTILWASHYADNFFTQVTVQPRINYFQSINQQLPLVNFGIRPFPLGTSGIIFDNWFSAGYLDYVYSTPLQSRLPSSKSGRFETNNTLYRHFNFGPVTFTPSTGFIGIFYTNTHHHHAVGQAIAAYGFDLNTTLYKTYPSFKHTLQPYFRYRGYSSPTTPNHDHYIFDIQDGYAQQNLFRPGLLQSFYSNILPDMTFDLYTNIFLGPLAFHRTLPKLYLTSEFSYPSWAVVTDLVYNAQELLWDRANIKTEWTVSESFAFGIEFRHRSRYDWRKADHDNYIVDIDRTLDQLLHSPLSDGRNTLLSKFQIRFTPLWSCHIETHHGWGRKNDPRYDAYEIKLVTLITGKWQVEIGYKYTPALKEWVFPSIKLLSTEF